MIVSINQPCYLPWLGYFDRIRQSDLHIVLDHVQLEKGSFTNRTRIRGRDGRVFWLTVPVEKGKPINETKTKGTNWRPKHARAIRESYGYGDFYPAFYDKTSLLANCLSTSAWLGSLLSLDTLIRLSSDLGGSGLGKKSDLVLNLCKEVGATTYLSGLLGRQYLNEAAFERAGIQVRYHDYQPAENPPLSALDYLFNPRSKETWPLAHQTSPHSSTDSVLPVAL